MPSRIDEAGHTKAFDYPVAEHWGESRNIQFCGWDSNRQYVGPESNTLPTESPRFWLEVHWWSMYFAVFVMPFVTDFS